jgi:hypothetical protein
MSVTQIDGAYTWADDLDPGRHDSASILVRLKLRVVIPAVNLHKFTFGAKCNSNMHGTAEFLSRFGGWRCPMKVFRYHHA